MNIQLPARFALGVLKCSWLFIFIQCSRSKPTTLPEKMPDDIAMSFREQGYNYLPYTSIRVTKDSLFYLQRKEDKRTEIRWEAAITRAEAERIFRLFRDNRIDVLKNDSTGYMWREAASEELSLYYAGKSYQLNRGSNTPLGVPESKRFKAVKEGIVSLAEKKQVIRP